MAVEAPPATAAPVAAPAPPPKARRGDRIRTWSLGIWSALALLYLFIPIFVIVVFSFNDPAGRFNFTWQGFTLDHWLHPFTNPDLATAMKNSLLIAGISTAVATALGTFMAMALVRYGFRGRSFVDFFVFLPLSTPEVVIGAALLALFLTMAVNTGFATILGTFMAMALVRYGFRGRSLVDFFVFLPLSTPEVVIGAALLALFLTVSISTGFVTIVIAHVMFTVSYVVVTVKARLEGMDRHIEEAAMDLGATEWTAFRKITLPMIAPGVAAAALLAAAISVDDYVITSFNAGQTITFPLFIFGATRQGVPPEVNVLATGLLLIVLILMGLNVMLQRRLARRDVAAQQVA